MSTQEENAARIQGALEQKVAIQDARRAELEARAATGWHVKHVGPVLLVVDGADRPVARMTHGGTPRERLAAAKLAAAAPTLRDLLIDVRANVGRDDPAMWGRVDAALAATGA